MVSHRQTSISRAVGVAAFMPVDRQAHLDSTSDRRPFLLVNVPPAFPTRERHINLQVLHHASLVRPGLILIKQ